MSRINFIREERGDRVYSTRKREREEKKERKKRKK